MCNFYKLSLIGVLIIFAVCHFNSSAQNNSSQKQNDLIDSLYQQAKMHYTEGNHSVALPIYLKIDSITKKNNLLNEYVIKSILERAEISRTTFTYDGVETAKVLQLEALSLAQQLKSEELEHDVYLRLADIFGMIDQVDSAKFFIDKAYKYYKEQDNALKLNRVYQVYMNYYFSTDKLDSAGIYLQEGISYLSGKNLPKELAIINYYYANYLEKYLNDYPKALEQFNKTKLMFQALGDTTNRYYWYLTEGIAYTYAGLEDYKSAFEYYQESFDVKRRLDKQSDNDLSLSLEKKYQAQKKEQEIKLLNAQNQLSEEQKQNQLIMLVVILIALLFIAIFLFILYRNRQKITLKLKELDSTKSRFFANISHEFRTPLTLIKGSAQIELNSEASNGSLIKHLNIIDKNADSMLELVDQLLDLSKLEANKMSLKVKPVDIKEWISIQTEPFNYLAQQNSLRFQVKSDYISGTIYIDPEMLEKVIMNLLSNAIKYTNENGEIIVNTTIQNGKLTVSVKNTGKIISSEQQDKIFDRFYQVNGGTTGVGIGLAMVKEIVELHKGSITYTSTDNFNRFQIEIPCKASSYTPMELQDSENGKRKVLSQKGNKSLETGVATTEILAPNGSKGTFKKGMLEELPIMLIVDDNSDIRSLIKEQFEKAFEIAEAENGQKGIAKAFQIIPDIIISDVMMPVTDGIALCNTLKKDERTSHIPIIMLTAKAGEENELQGLENGADDYILKPFNNKILKTRVEKLIEIRKMLRERYSYEVILKPMDIAIAPADEVFLDKVQNLLDSKLAEPDFTAEKFSSEIGMSRMQLHRKLKALTGLSTTEFIRSQRMKIGLDLLKTRGITIAEVAYAVGFNDPSYFAKCFRTTYNYTPTQYLETNKKKNVV